MLTVITVLARLVEILRVVFLGAAAVLAVVCLLDWLVRTRRISPFSGVARLVRRTVDPLLAPVERQVLRRGGNPQQTPWWALGAVIVGGIVVISLLTAIVGQLAGLAIALEGGSRGIVSFAVRVVFGILQLALLVRVLSSWLPVSPYSPWVRWTYPLTDWFLVPLRRVIPALGPMDVSPIVAYFVLQLLEGVVLGALR